MESSIAVFLERQPACELLPTDMKGHRQSHCRFTGKRYSGAMLACVFDSVAGGARWQKAGAPAIMVSSLYHSVHFITHQSFAFY
jgi:hypothetical protein